LLVLRNVKNVNVFTYRFVHVYYYYYYYYYYSAVIRVPLDNEIARLFTRLYKSDAFLFFFLFFPFPFIYLFIASQRAMTMLTHRVIIWLLNELYRHRAPCIASRVTTACLFPGMKDTM